MKARTPGDGDPDTWTGLAADLLIERTADVSMGGRLEIDVATVDGDAKWHFNPQLLRRVSSHGHTYFRALKPGRYALRLVIERVGDCPEPPPEGRRVAAGADPGPRSSWPIEVKPAGAPFDERLSRAETHPDEFEGDDPDPGAIR